MLSVSSVVSAVVGLASGSVVVLLLDDGPVVGVDDGRGLAVVLLLPGEK